MSDIVDALVFTSIKNNIPKTDPQYKKIDTGAAFVGLGDEDKEKKINDILLNTTIKRACCLAKSGDEANIDEDEKNYKIKVKIPIPPNYTPNNIEKKFGYINKEILVPKSYCNEVLPLFDSSGNAFLTGQCDPFYNLYCENMKYLYKLENNNSYSPKEFFEYASDCACHANIPLNTPPNFSKSCVLDFCDWSNKPTVYLDSTSRDKVCEGTFCSAVTNIGKSEVGGSSQLSFTNKVIQNCDPDKSGSKVNGQSEKTTNSDGSDSGGSDSGGSDDADGSDSDKKDKKGTTPSSPPSGPLKNKNMLFAGGSILIICCIIIFVLIIFSKNKNKNKNINNQ